jgi:Predicted periplasmic or secreted lipoprotein
VKRYKVNEIIKMLEKDEWYLVATNGSHRQFKHKTKKGRVTINGKLSETLGQELLNSIFKQAGWSK